MATWNIDGLTSTDWPYIAYLFYSQEWDVLLLVDTKLDPTSHTFAIKGLQALTTAGTVITGSPTSTSTFDDTSTNTHHGGLLWLINPKWSGAISGPVYNDPSQEGVVSRISLAAHGQSIHLIGAYFPIPNTPHSTSLKLSSRVESFAKRTKTYNQCTLAIDYVYQVVE